jgi:GT2 family glycosyltransferase
VSRLLVVTPARNEADHIDAMAAAVAAQTRPPDLWVVVDDSSTDDTLARARALERELGFLRVLEAPAVAATGGDRLAVAAEARAFNWALAQTGAEGFDYVGKLDADIVVDPRHFERLVAELESDPKLGIAGCWLVEEHGGRWVHNVMPEYHVNGAVKLYRAGCLREIGGVEERLAWDTIDQTRARMLGWKTRSLHGIDARHLRRSGSAAGVLRGSARHGECVWIVAYPLPVVLLRALRLAIGPPPRLAGPAFLYGWLRAAVRQRGRVEDPALRAFSRREQWARVAAPILAAWPIRLPRRRRRRR